jgi:hypothetical protein
VAELARNDQGRVRIGRIDATIRLAEAADDIAHAQHCRAQFEDFCVVTDERAARDCDGGEGGGSDGEGGVCGGVRVAAPGHKESSVAVLFRQ